MCASPEDLPISVIGPAVDLGLSVEPGLAVVVVAGGWLVVVWGASVWTVGAAVEVGIVSQSVRPDRDGNSQQLQRVVN